jgi:hypothetical protein
MLEIVVFPEMSSLLGENSCLFCPGFMPRKKYYRLIFTKLVNSVTRYPVLDE